MSAVSASNRRAGKATPRLLILSLLALGGLFLLVALAIRLAGDRLPRLTQDRFDSALRQWSAAAPASYEIAVEVSGNQPARYRVVVRNGEVESAERNGAPLSGARTLGTWSVPGMFRTIEIDLDEQARAAADGNQGELILWSEFDPQYGYPARYRREQWGNNQKAAWQVTSFQTLP